MSTSAVAVEQVSARLLRSGEQLPLRLIDDWLLQLIKLDSNWIWIAEKDSVVIGCLVAMPQYPMVNMLRLRMDSDAPHHGMLVLLRQFFRDCRQRTFQSMCCQFDMNVTIENRLGMCMAKRFGGKTFVNVCAPLPKED